jgi:LPS sulfotransferase NodH
MPSVGPEILGLPTRIPVRAPGKPQFSRRLQRVQFSVSQMVASTTLNKSYAICTNPRSGSWLLSEGLAFTSLAGYPLEWLNIAEEQKRRAHWHLSFPDDSSLPHYLRTALRSGQTSNGIFGIKLQYYQFKDLTERLAAHEEFKGLSSSDLMSKVFPKIQYIWLTRRDKARQAISFYRAYKTGRWWVLDRPGSGGDGPRVSNVDFAPATVLRLEESLRLNDIGWQAYFSANDIKPLTLFYEDFVTTYVETLRTVLKWLNIPDAEIVPIRDPCLTRQSDAQTEQWLAEYLEFKERSKRDAQVAAAQPEHAIEITSPLYDVTKTFRERSRIPQRPNKVLSLLGAFRELENLRPGVTAIERRSKLSRDQFLAEFYACNRPVVLEGLMQDWPAMTRWNQQYLKEKAGADDVQVETERTIDSDDALGLAMEKKTVRFSDLINSVYSEGVENGPRIEGDNAFFQHKRTRDLLSDFKCFGEYLDLRTSSTQSYFWFAPSGNTIPLHHDPWNSLLAQVVGRRHIKMIPASQWEFVYNEIGNSSRVDCANPDFARWPMFRHATVIDIEQEPGDVLFVPVGWWYHVRVLTVSIAISFTNFLFPNKYYWPQQGYSDSLE